MGRERKGKWETTFVFFLSCFSLLLPSMKKTEVHTLSLKHQSIPVVLINHPFWMFFRSTWWRRHNSSVKCAGERDVAALFWNEWIRSGCLTYPSPCTVGINWSDCCEWTELEAIACLEECGGGGCDNYWLWNWKYYFTVKHFQRYCRLKFQSISRGFDLITNTDVRGPGRLQAWLVSGTLPRYSCFSH